MAERRHEPTTAPAHVVAAALALAARGLHGATGTAFFRALVEQTARQLGADHVLVAELVPGGRMRTRAYWRDGGPVDDAEYELAGTPCEAVLAGTAFAWSRDVQGAFPGSAVLGELAAEAYVGSALLAPSGEPLGILAALYRAPQPDLALARSVLEIFSPRAAVELERQRTEHALRESEQRLALALDAAGLGTWDRSLEHPAVPAIVNDRWFEMIGYRRGDFAPSYDRWIALVHPDDRAGLERSMSAYVSGEAPSYETTYRVRAKDGTWRWITARAVLTRGPDGRPRRVTGTLRDVTDQRRHDHDLLQSQKLEAIGRLAGGVAHDFNNLLTSMLTAIEFAVESLPGDAAAREDLAIAKEAAERAADLTRQLLAFARRQNIVARAVDLNALVTETERLLRRSLGEDVRLVTALASTAWPVRADPTQLQQVLVNLAVNARDAMPDGGVLTVETANVLVGRDAAPPIAGLAPGAWVRLCVSDSGEGMDPDTVTRVFEPFFTTKEGGRGTGLGLPTVYGIVTQLGGHIAVQSERGVGTSVKIWLPRAGPAEAGERAPAEPQPRGGSETLLLVEDDPLVLATSARILEALGYRVLKARGGDEALAVIRARAVDLLVTDVVMPRMPGTTLAREVERLRPGTPVLFVSGYAAGAALGVVLRDRGDAFLPKPFTPRVLAAKVRDVLDRAGAASRAYAGKDADRG